MMKAYWVSVGYEWGDYVHAETVSKAKSKLWQEFGGFEIEEWTWLRAKRVPSLDNIPLSSENIHAHLERLMKEDGLLGFDEACFPWTTCCKCNICRKDNE